VATSEASTAPSSAEATTPYEAATSPVATTTGKFL